jgi:protein SCO1/2
VQSWARLWGFPSPPHLGSGLALTYARHAKRWSEGLEDEGRRDPGNEVVLSKRLLWFAAALTGVIAVAAGILYFTKSPGLHGAVINPPVEAHDFQLTDFNGAPFTLSSLQGQPVILYFGYTNCPDECPLTMAHLKLAVQMLGDQSGAVRILMITTDPARDTADALHQFLGKFDPAFVGLYGTPEQLGKVWQAYGVAVENGGETHSNYIYVLDRAGRLRETFLPDSLAADEAADLKLLLSEGG